MVPAPIQGGQGAAFVAGRVGVVVGDGVCWLALGGGHGAESLERSEGGETGEDE